MSRFYCEFQNRDGTDRPSRPWRSVEVERYSWIAKGGPNKVQIRASGSDLDIWELVEMIRCPVIIWDTKRGKQVWWGYLEAVDLCLDEWRTVTIESMSNAVAVAYTNNQKRQTTAWDTNTESVTEYGRKDLLLSASDLQDSQALVYRNTELGFRKYPSLSLPEDRTVPEHYAAVNGRGWYETLDWRYFSRNDGVEAYEEINGFIGREIGEDDRPVAAQSFKNSADENWNAYSVFLRVRNVGTPGDSLRVDLCTPTGANPGASQANASVADSDMSDYMQWVEFELSGAVPLTSGSTYWIKIARTGAVNETNYYMVDGNDGAGYLDGAMKIGNGATWEDWYNQSCDLNFKVVGKEETTAQIARIVSDVGDLLVTCDIDDTSGAYTEQFRYGDNTGWYEITKMLDIGTASARRLLATVEANRHLRVYEEPALWEADYSMDKDGVIMDSLGALVDPADCPVGIYMRLEDTIPSSVDVSRLTTAGYVFVEEAEYNCQTNQYTIIKTRDTDILRDLFGNVNG